ncbi:MAG: hypothetical protein A2W29_09795 [Gemmatimonadetes bacterium RBG_16_66_8]|nr:MAG: hypothetical protein A2W29_09795 [Gemmatimonadetes bacterium RBG_16_66_8]
MTDEALYTLREVAQRLDLHESTARYYRDIFAAFLPTVGTGRRRLYPASALEAFRLIAAGFANRESRSAIEAGLSDLTGSSPPLRTAVAVPADIDRDDLSRPAVVAAILDGERERREAMWQMAREMFRLGEAIERQQVLLNQLAERVATADRALPAPISTPTAPHDIRPPDAAALDGDRELADLRAELEQERELVERLRRSKLDIERRAAEAEARLGAAGAEGGGARKSLLDRLLMRD